MTAIYVQQYPVVTIQPTMEGQNPFKTMNNGWHSDLCDCCSDISGCCYAYFCCCCFLCQIADTIGESRCSCCCLPNVLAVYRMKVRSILHIKGDACSDCCTTTFCGFCAGIQMNNELKYHGIR